MTEPAQLSFDFLSDRELSYEEIKGRINSIIYENPDTGWKVVEVKQDADETPVKLAGFLPNIQVNDFIQARCTELDNHRFGNCLQIDEFKKILPFEKEAVVKFMISMIDGIGERLAERIVTRFREATLEILEITPERLIEVEGITKNLVDKIITSTERINTTVRELILLGFSPKWAGRIYLKYGKDAPEIIKQKPYRLIRDFKGIGFKKADTIARIAGIDTIDEARIRAAVFFTMKSTLNKTGQNFLYIKELVYASSRLLKLPFAYIESAVLSETKLVIEEDRVYLPKYYNAEERVSKMISDKLKLAPSCIDNFNKLVRDIEDKTHITFTDEQRDAIHSALVSPVTVITGVAGTGKSTLCRGLLGILDKLDKIYEVCAPTGKAANKLESLTGVRVSTIHRLFRYAPRYGFRVNKDSPLSVDYLIVDEASMVDLLLFDSILQGISGKTRLVLIGDPHQLPPVLAGNSLQALMGSYSVSQVILPEIFRQKKESTILRNANLVNLAKCFPVEDTEDFKFIDAVAPEKMMGYLYNSIEELRDGGYHPIRDINILTPLNKGGGDISVSMLNLRLQNYLNPRLKSNYFYVYEREFRTGDKIMQRKNDYELDIYNGEIGFIKSYCPEQQTVEIDFIRMTKNISYRDMDNITLNYAMTVHKSQGSEVRAVIFLATRAGCYFLLNKNLFYTAMTRAREKLIMIMPYEVVKMALRYTLERKSTLASRIQQRVIGREPGGRYE